MTKRKTRAVRSAELATQGIKWAMAEHIIDAEDALRGAKKCRDRCKKERDRHRRCIDRIVELVDLHADRADRAENALARICEEVYSVGKYSDVTPAYTIEGVQALREKFQLLCKEVNDHVAGVRSRIHSLAFAAPEQQHMHLKLIEELCKELLSVVEDK